MGTHCCECIPVHKHSWIEIYIFQFSWISKNLTNWQIKHALWTRITGEEPELPAGALQALLIVRFRRVLLVVVVEIGRASGSFHNYIWLLAPLVSCAELGDRRRDRVGEIAIAIEIEMSMQIVFSVRERASSCAHLVWPSGSVECV